MPSIVSHPHPDHPGWVRWEVDEPGYFNEYLGTIIARPDGAGGGRVRMLAPERRHGNILDAVHGGVLLAFADISLFAGAGMAGVADVAGAQTIDLTMQFLSAGRIGSPLEAEVDLLRETRRFAFLRGLIRQDDTKVAGFTGTIRKPSAPRG